MVACWRADGKHFFKRPMCSFPSIMLQHPSILLHDRMRPLSDPEASPGLTWLMEHLENDCLGIGPSIAQAPTTR